MGISFGSINTGLPKDIVQQLIKAEKIPLKKMDIRKSKVADKKKLVDQLTTMMTELRDDLIKSQDAKNLRELKVETDDTAISVTLDKTTAVPGIYQFEVDKLSQKSSAMTNGFEDENDSYIGVGFIQYTLPDGETKEIYVDSENSSLAKISKLINEDESIGMKANVVNDGSGSDTPWRLILSLSETGDESLAEFPYFYFVDGEDDLFVEFEREAHDASVKIDGFTVEKNNNSIQDLIPGATIDLKKAKPGEEFTIKITEDKEAITTKITDLIEKINNILKFIKKQNTLDEKSDTSRTLGGDSLLSTIQARLRNAIFQGVKTSKGMMRVGDLGITFQRNGLIEFDEKKFDSLMAKDFRIISQILTGSMVNGVREPGFISNIKKLADESLRLPYGVLPLRKKTFQSKIDDIDRKIVNKQRLIDQKEQNLKNKFARLESTISKLKNQGAGMGALQQASFNPVQQLG